MHVLLRFIWLAKPIMTYKAVPVICRIWISMR